MVLGRLRQVQHLPGVAWTGGGIRATLCRSQQRKDGACSVCWSLLSLTLTARISHFPFFFFKPRQKGLSPLSSIRNLKEGLGVAPAYENGVGVRPEGEILLP